MNMTNKCNGRVWVSSFRYKGHENWGHWQNVNGLGGVDRGNVPVLIPWFVRLWWGNIGYSTNYVVYNLECWSESSRRFVTIQIAELHSRISDSGGLEWGSRICISNILIGNTDAALRATDIREYSCFRKTNSSIHGQRVLLSVLQDKNSSSSCACKFYLILKCFNKQLH